MGIAPVSGHRPDALWRRVIAFPSTRAGRMSAWLTGGVMGLLAAVGGLVAAGLPDWGALVTIVLGVSALLGVLTAVVAGGIALRAITHGERSIVVLGPLLFGGYCVLFLAGLLLAH